MSHDRTKKCKPIILLEKLEAPFDKAFFFPSEITTEATNTTEASEKAFIYFTN